MAFFEIGVHIQTKAFFNNHVENGKNRFHLSSFVRISSSSLFFIVLFSFVNSTITIWMAWETGFRLDRRFFPPESLERHTRFFPLMHRCHGYFPNYFLLPTHVILGSDVYIWNISDLFQCTLWPSRLAGNLCRRKGTKFLFQRISWFLDMISHSSIDYVSVRISTNLNISLLHRFISKS